MFKTFSEFLESTAKHGTSLIRSSTVEHKGFNTPEASSHLHWQRSQRTLDNEDLTQLMDAYHWLIKLANWFQIKTYLFEPKKISAGVVAKILTLTLQPDCSGQIWIIPECYYCPVLASNKVDCENQILKEVWLY